MDSGSYRLERLGNGGRARYPRVHAITIVPSRVRARFAELSAEDMIEGAEHTALREATFDLVDFCFFVGCPRIALQAALHAVSDSMVAPPMQSLHAMVNLGPDEVEVSLSAGPYTLFAGEMLWDPTPFCRGQTRVVDPEYAALIIDVALAATQGGKDETR